MDLAAWKGNWPASHRASKLNQDSIFKNFKYIAHCYTRSPQIQQLKDGKFVSYSSPAQKLISLLRNQCISLPFWLKALENTYFCVHTGCGQNYSTEVPISLLVVGRGLRWGCYSQLLEYVCILWLVVPFLHLQGPPCTDISYASNLFDLLFCFICPPHPVRGRSLLLIIYVIRLGSSVLFWDYLTISVITLKHVCIISLPRKITHS